MAAKQQAGKSAHDAPSLSTGLGPSWDPGSGEERWYQFWLSRNYFRPQPNTGQPSYCIVIPPPNITGSLHMGHALNNTLQDILIRFKRMDGYQTLWMPGTDHAGIATQHVLERLLAQEGTSRHHLGREAFVERIWQWRQQAGGTIIQQLMRLGASCDWSRERFTLDADLSRAVREVFVRLYEEGLIYRGDYIINWCPHCLTALSDLEVEYEEKQGLLYVITYPLQGGQGSLQIATTRPETMLGDAAVAVHPEDPRYTHLVGQQAILPLLGRALPIIADPYVDRSFGTGVLKVTPAHDPNDFEIGLRHHLPALRVMNDDATMNQEAGRFQGMDRFACRQALLKDLQAEGLLIRAEDYPISLGHCYRCKTVVEPTLSKQWFVRVASLAEPAIEAVRQGRVRIIPRGWEKTYFEWMLNIKDWCISRQIWWGHRIPAWYCHHCPGLTVARDEPQRCSACGGTDLRQEDDVLDTWFSSALWPFSTLGWPQETVELRRFYPTAVLVTGFDILFFWVARMIMMGLKCMGEVPFRRVYIHALVRDAQGQKMSKSRGNVLDPLVLMERYGTDAFRFTLAAFAAQGRDVKLSEGRIEGYRHFVNKLWNAARFVLTGLTPLPPPSLELPALNTPKTLEDRWILSRLQHAISATRQALEEYKFNVAAGRLYQFFWHEFCDWYIELAKPYLQGGGQERQTCQGVLLTILEQSLRLLHPFMPFVTEEIWQQLPAAIRHGQESIMVSPYPTPQSALVDRQAERIIALCREAVEGIRKIRGEMNIPASKALNACIVARDAQQLALLEGQRSTIERLTRLESLTLGDRLEKPPGAATAVSRNLEIFVPLAGVLDAQVEMGRLDKEIRRVEKDLASVHRKLGSREFLAKAPAEVVQKERRKARELEASRERLQQSLRGIQQLMA